MIDNPAATATEGSLNRAIKDIDEALGNGYAKQHPELIAGHMQACAMWNVGLETASHPRNLADAERTEN